MCSPKAIISLICLIITLPSITSKKGQKSQKNNNQQTNLDKRVILELSKAINNLGYVLNRQAETNKMLINKQGKMVFKGREDQKGRDEMKEESEDEIKQESEDQTIPNLHNKIEELEDTILSLRGYIDYELESLKDNCECLRTGDLGDKFVELMDQESLSDGMEEKDTCRGK